MKLTIPIILISTLGREEDVRRGMEAGGDGVHPEAALAASHQGRAARAARRRLD